MKLFLVLASILVFTGSAYAKDGKNSRNLSFEEILVQGKYQFSDEATVSVEQDKVLDSLLSVRKNFKDRIKKVATQH